MGHADLRTLAKINAVGWSSVCTGRALEEVMFSLTSAMFRTISNFPIPDDIANELWDALLPVRRARYAIWNIYV